MRPIFWIAIGCLVISQIYGKEIRAELQGGYYRPTDSDFFQIYSGGGIYGVEFSVKAWRSLYPWVSGSVFTKSGHSIGYDSCTHATFVPIGIGLKYAWELKSYLNVYVGAGALPTYLWVHDHSPYVVQKTVGWGCGGIVKAGIWVDLPDCFFLDLFSDYFSVEVPSGNNQNNTVTTQSAHLKGWTLGFGIGRRFY